MIGITNIGVGIAHGGLLTSTAEMIVNWLNMLTNTSDTVYDGEIPAIADIEASADLINGEII